MGSKHFRLSCEKKDYSIVKELGWSTCPLPFFLQRRGQMNGLLHLWRFSSLKRAHKRLWNAPLALPVHGRAPGDTEAWQRLALR
jgi:hypothetical protein